MTNKFVIGDRVRHIGGTAEGLVKSEPLTAGAIWVKWDDKEDGYCLTRIDSLELVLPPAPCPFVVGDRVRHIGGTVEGTVKRLYPSQLGFVGFGRVAVRWDDAPETDFPWAFTTRTDSLELAPAHTVAPPPEPKPHPWDTQRDKIGCSDRITIMIDASDKRDRYLAIEDGDPLLCGTYIRVERLGRNGWEDVGND